MNSIEDIKGYTLVEKQELSEMNGVGYVLSHDKTKARVLVVCNDDKDKVFTIGFRTPPADDTGVAHITEHSVLCGSKKFPVKDPFVELCKGSLNTFLNAMTYPDKTVYPVSSMNHKDFHNLMHVYLDAVFYPNIYEKNEILMQEGWHYEVDEATGNLIYNGVVYNEMKGVFSDPEQQLARVVQASLLKDTPYSKESGGDPLHIPELSQEMFLDFHSRYYHPSNSYIYLYGDGDFEKELRFIDDEYLSKFDYLEIDSSIPEQAAFDKPVYVTDYYSLAEADLEQDNTYLTYNVVTGSSLDKKRCIAFSILDYVLFTVPNAPIKKALIDAGIGKDVFSSYDDGIKQTNFSITAKNANVEDEERFVSIIDEMFEKLVTEGINKRSLLAAINHFEFRHKEANHGRFSKGLISGLNAFGTWLYDDSKALDLFSLNEVFDSLKEEIDNGYFENLIKTYFIENTHKSYVKLVPKKGLNEEKDAKETEKLLAYKESLSKEELDKIIKTTEHLKEYQQEADTEEAIATLPMLTLEDIDKKIVHELKNDISEIEMVKIVHHNIFTNGIAYLHLHFDITDIDSDKYPYASLLTEMLQYVATEHYSVEELSNEVDLQTGGIGISTCALPIRKEDENYGHKVFFLANIKTLYNNIDKGVELLEEILFSSDLNDKKKLREVVAECRSNLRNELVATGHMTASGRAMSYISKLGAAKELLSGVDYYSFLADLDDNFDEKCDETINELKTVIGQALRRGGLTISYTGDKAPKDILLNPITRLSKRLSTRLSFDNAKEPEIVVKNEGFKTSSQVQYVATAGNYIEQGFEYTGSLAVLRSIFSYEYLWLNVRVMGGAYGCMCGFGKNGESFFTSYRDPNLMETYGIYEKAYEYVKTFEASDEDMTKYIIGTVSGIDAPFTPSAEGAFSFTCYLMGETNESLQKQKDEVLGTTASDIRNLAGHIKAIANNGIICAVGNEKKIEEAKEHFKEVKSVF